MQNRIYSNSNKSELGDQFLFSVSKGNIAETVKILEKDLSVIDYMWESRSALIDAVCLRNLEMTTLLIKSRANLDLQDKYHGYTALMSAMHVYNSEFAILLIKSGADVNICSWRGQTCLHIAAECNYHQYVSLLIDEGAYVNQKTQGSVRLLPCEGDLVYKKDEDADGFTPLYLTACSGHVESASILIQRGADVNLQHNNTGRTPLHEIVSHAISLIKSLVDIEDVMKYTSTMIRLLLNKGADLYIEDVNYLYYFKLS
jgi:ankyrin repeat protein